MPKLTWNTFIQAHPSATLLGAAVVARLPAQMTFDGAGRKLPTPYALFVEAITLLMNGPWATTTVSGGFVVGVVEQADLATVTARFGPLRVTGFKIGPKSVPLLNYDNSKYVPLAKQLGYDVKATPR